MDSFDDDVRIAQETADSTSKSDPDYAEILNDLGRALQSRYDHTNSIDDINRAVQAFDDSIKYLYPDCPPITRAEYLNDLATSLKDQFDITSSIETLDHAIVAFEESVALAIEANDPERYIYLQGLGNALEDRVQLTNQLTDLDRAITVYDMACDISPSDAVDKPLYHNNLGGALVDRFERVGTTQDLFHAVVAYEEAIKFAGEDSPKMPLYLNNLGYALHTRSEVSNSNDDLDLALEVCQRSLDSVDNDEDRAKFSGNFANALQLLFRRTGDAKTLNRAISLYNDAIQASSPDGADHGMFRNNLGNALQRRYAWTGSLDDLERALEEYKAALDVWSDLSNLARFLTDFGMAKRRIFLHDESDQTNNLKYLDEAIELFTAALEHTPDGNNDRAMCLFNLANAMLDRFELTHSLEDLNQAADLHRNALICRRDLEGDPDRGRFLHNLALVLSEQFSESDTHPIKLLDEAISLFREASQCTPPSQPEYAIYLISLGQTLKKRYDHMVPPNSVDLMDSTTAFQQALHSSTASPTTRIVAALCIVQQLEEGNYEIANRALQIAIELLPSTASYNLRRIDQQFNLTVYSGLASAAAATALAAGEDPAKAACLLETGRGIILGHLLDLRNDITNLRPDLAAKYYSLTTILDPELPSADIIMQFTPAEMMDMRHQAAIQFDQLKEEIRQESGYEDFFTPVTPQNLMDQSRDGPIVLVNVNTSRSDALLITSSSITCEPLSNLTMECVQSRIEAFHNGITMASQGHRQRNYSQVNEAESNILEILEWLWDTIAEPILSRLGFTSTPQDRDISTWPRIWWCPTGILSYLPLHAAGYHRQLLQMPSRCVIDRIVSAYIPTIRALKYARKTLHAQSKSTTQRALIIAMESTPGYARLPVARDEAYYIEGAIFDQGMIEDVDVEESPTLAYMSQKLPGATIAHFACHALSTVEPSDSGILLVDGKLKVGAISQMRLQTGALAYLSACNTATSKATDLRDECITLSSAFQVAGFARVVGTLWKSEDHTSYKVAATFYGVLQSDVTRSAIALHQAIVQQRASNPLTPSLWAGYVYTGC